MYTFRIILFALLVLPSTSHARVASDVVAMGRELAAIQQDYDIPAISIGVIADGKVVYADGAGHLDEQNGSPVTKSTLFRIASISKLFTAQAIMQLVEREKLHLDDRISLYLTDFDTSHITVGQLMSHVSGIKDQISPAPDNHNRQSPEYLKEVIQSLEDIDLIKEFNYSDTGFNLLGAIVSKVSGTPFEDYIQANILQPAHMTHSGFFDGTAGVKPEVLATHRGKVIPPNQQRPYDPSFYPSEGLVSNVSDLSSWLLLTLSHDTELLNEDTYNEMLQPRVKTTWGEIYVGLGWQVYRESDQLVARHPGSLRGYKSLLVSYPESQNGLVLLTNASEVPRFEIAKRIVKKLYDLKIWM